MKEVIEKVPLYFLCSLLLYISVMATNQSHGGWTINSVLYSITEHWPQKGLLPSLHAISIFMEMGRGKDTNEEQVPSERGGRYFLVNIKRFEQEPFLKYGPVFKAMLLSGSRFLPTEVLPPGLTLSSGAMTWNTGGCRSEWSKWMARAISGLVCSPSETRKVHTHKSAVGWSPSGYFHKRVARDF